MVASRARLLAPGVGNAEITRFLIESGADVNARAAEAMFRPAAEGFSPNRLVKAGRSL